MTNDLSLASLETGDHSPAPYVASQVAQPPVRFLPDFLSDKGDTTVRDLEKHCYAQFQIAPTNAAKADWIHNLAACMVELHKRGLTIGGRVA